jgi:hypothetical protein
VPGTPSLCDILFATSSDVVRRERCNAWALLLGFALALSFLMKTNGEPTDNGG